MAPFTTYKFGSDGNYVYSGILVELFTCLSRSLRFTYEYINEDPKEVALYGQALPAINQLTNKASENSIPCIFTFSLFLFFN